jgi:hypothetical protein
MNTLVFCTSILTEETLFTYSEWWNYYRSKFPNATFLIVNDGVVANGLIKKLKQLTNNQFDESNIISFDEKLGRESHFHWGWWRSFRTAVLVGKERFDKIIHIECDAIILSQRLFNYLNDTNTGWRCLFSNSYGFPESAIQILNKDKFYLIDSLPENFDFYKIVELYLPFKSERTFIGDRYGEIGKLPNHKIDYVCQWNWNWYIDDDWIEN